MPAEKDAVPALLSVSAPASVPGLLPASEYAHADGACFLMNENPEAFAGPAADEDVPGVASDAKLGGACSDCSIPTGDPVGGDASTVGMASTGAGSAGAGGGGDASGLGAAASEGASSAFGADLMKLNIDIFIAGTNQTLSTKSTSAVARLN